MLDLGNLMTAMVTPFNQDLEVDYNILQKLSLNLIENKTTGLVVFGTTGESPTLTKEEKLNIVKSVKEISNGVPVIAGSGSYSTKDTIELSQECEKAGADALLIVSPYYNKPDQRGLYEHFKSVANSVNIPVILYNHPGRTGVTIEVSTLEKLIEIDNIVAIKDSSCNIELSTQYLRVATPNFKVYSGDDSVNFPLYCLGAAGAVSVASHIVGKQISEMFNLIDQKELKKAREIHFSLVDLFKALFCAPSPAPVKAALNLKGINAGGVRLPLTSLTEENYNRILNVVNKI
ncbi:MAG: 4-hydroxy-tetrahydrodipicolinate synthase [Candidatus Sericytochromatia bacterium]|nr:4-hydroxy-tetrahydrodipicolinate synthase [Candidatus Sericytochromatia bacterium]